MTRSGLEALEQEELACMEEVGPKEFLCQRCERAHMAAVEQIERARERVHPDAADEHIEVPRTIPQPVKDYVDLKYGFQCARPGCGGPIDVYHHIDGFSAIGIHPPNRILPLCATHNSLVHEGIETEAEWGFQKPWLEGNRAMIDFHFSLVRSIKQHEKTDKLMSDRLTPRAGSD